MSVLLSFTRAAILPVFCPAIDFASLIWYANDIWKIGFTINYFGLRPARIWSLRMSGSVVMSNSLQNQPLIKGEQAMNEVVFYLVLILVLVALAKLAWPFKQYVLYKLGKWPKPSWIKRGKLS